ncbi:MAG: cyclic nucleotide-binding domain-containing protein [Deltaproteobacteria bacterium]|nr:cyclic nucleotide-binding domain-containing protein [Deltaproteobacteria bacterium]
MREFLQNREVFRGLSDASIQRIAEAIEEVSLPVDTSLFREGEPADALYIIRAGSVRVMKQLPAGGEALVIAHLPAGTVIGERGVLDGTVRVASVVTDTPSVFWKLRRSTVQALAATDPLLRSRVHALVLARGHLPPTRDLPPEGDAGIE